MLTNQFQDLTLSRLGFGAMRLPTRDDGSVDEEQVDAMVDYALDHGVNYFDTAWPYHGGTSEIILGKSLRRYPRERWLLADKYPGHQISSTYDPADIFERQLKKCGVDHFDFYLLHNVYENSIEVYMDPRWGILDYFLEQKRQGRIRHLGFSCHGRMATLERFLDYAGHAMEFCQIQLNYVDWTLQSAKEKYELLSDRGIPVWVMEPVRGGKLAALSETAAAELRGLRSDHSPAAWAFRFVQDLPNVKMVLSGMSDISQMTENVATFEAEKPLSAAERAALMAVAEGIKNSVPCTACRYCVDVCPQGLDIPLLLAVYNELRVAPSMNSMMNLDALPADKRADACLGCGACAQMCPQSIQIPEALSALTEKLAGMTPWAEICRQREEAAKALEG